MLIYPNDDALDYVGPFYTGPSHAPEFNFGTPNTTQAWPVTPPYNNPLAGVIPEIIQGFAIRYFVDYFRQQYWYEFTADPSNPPYTEISYAGLVGNMGTITHIAQDAYTLQIPAIDENDVWEYRYPKNSQGLNDPEQYDVPHADYDHGIVLTITGPQWFQNYGYQWTYSATYHELSARLAYYAHEIVSKGKGGLLPWMIPFFLFPGMPRLFELIGNSGGDMLVCRNRRPKKQ